MVGFGNEGDLMRTRSMVGVLALVLAVAVIGAGTAFAQTPVVPATTVGPPSDDKSEAEKPKAEKPKAEKPKPEKPKAEKPKADKPEPEKPTAQPPTAQQPTAQQPTAQQPAAPPKSPRPAQPKRIQSNAPSAQPNEPAPKPQVATTVSPRPKSVPSLPAAGASTASPDPLRTDSARSGGDSADARPVASRPTGGAPRREPRVANDGVAAAAAIRVDRQQGRVVAVESRPGYDVPLLLLALLLAMVFAVGLSDYIRDELRVSPSTAALRRRSAARAVRRRSKVPAFSGRVRYSVAAWSARVSARISTIAGAHAMTKEKAFAPGFMDLRSYSRASGAHPASSREAAYDRARRFRMTVGDRLRPLVAGRLSRRRR
jgi:hypothetical protein